MDEAVHVPVLGTRVGLDALLGIVPWSATWSRRASACTRWRRRASSAPPRWLQARMIGNLLADAALGAVPLAGDLADVYFKAHRRNMKLLQKAIGEPFIDVVEPLPARRR